MLDADTADLLRSRFLNSRYSAITALAAVFVFLILLSALHVFEPQLDPSRRLISEYELGRYGWVMSLAFFSLGAGVLAMLRSTWLCVATRKSRFGRWWFLAIGVALFGAGIFYPYTPPTLASYLHGLCGLLVILTFPIAATLYGSGLTQNNGWSMSQARLRWATALVWIGLLTFVGSIIVFGMLSPSADRSSLPIGWQNRFMIATYCVWLIIVAWSVAHSKNR